jgi:hypothetical protein
MRHDAHEPAEYIRLIFANARLDVKVIMTPASTKFVINAASSDLHLAKKPVLRNPYDIFYYKEKKQ